MLPPFNKSRDELVYILISRGMHSAAGLSDAELRNRISSDLAAVNYYRMSAYWYPFRKPLPAAALPKRAKSFLPGTCWETVWSYYQFDVNLRNLLFEAIGRIEIALRGAVAAVLASKAPESTNPQAVLSSYRNSFKVPASGRSHSLFNEMMDKVDACYHSSRGEGSRHYLVGKKIAHAKNLPVWVFMEYATFGNLNTLISSGLKRTDVEIIAKRFGFLSGEFFASAVALLHQVRNECAHQGRIWNRKWVKRPRLYAATPILKSPDRRDWKYCTPIHDVWMLAEDDPDILFLSPVCTATALTICHLMLRAIAPQCGWRERLIALLATCGLPNIHTEVGFTTPDWAHHSLWE